MNLSPAELRTLADLLERIQGTAKPRGVPVAKRKPQPKASAPNPAPTPPAAPASVSPAPADDDDAAKLETKRANRRKWAQAARARKRAKKAAATAQEGRRHNLAQTKRDRFARKVDAHMGVPSAPSPELQASANQFTDRELAAATGFSLEVCRDVQLGRACHAGVLSRISDGLARLREATGRDGQAA